MHRLGAHNAYAYNFIMSQLIAADLNRLPFAAFPARTGFGALGLTGVTVSPASHHDRSEMPLAGL